MGTGGPSAKNRVATTTSAYPSPFTSRVVPKLVSTAALRAPRLNCHVALGVGRREAGFVVGAEDGRLAFFAEA